MHARKAILAAAVTLVALGSTVALAAETPTAKLKAADERELAKRFAKFNDALPDAAKLGMSRLTAFEEHALFVYAAGDLPTRQIDGLEPGLHLLDRLVSGHRTERGNDAVFMQQAPEFLGPQPREAVFDMHRTT